MSKQLQILLAVIVTVSILIGFLLDHALISGAEPVKTSAGIAPPDPARRSARKIQWPVPSDPQEHNDYLATGRQLYFDKGCWNCHKLGNADLPGPLNLLAHGPDLGNVGNRLSGEEIFESIVNPNAVIAEPKEKYSNGLISKMPSPVANFSAGEVLQLTAFLASQTGRGDGDRAALVLPDTRIPDQTPATLASTPPMQPEPLPPLPAKPAAPTTPPTAYPPTGPGVTPQPAGQTP
ncbi:MAG TPA: cytochrome c [Planctomycetota bacterium]|nr:cytochrome c [Planctomycetota bacterium]